MTKRAFFLIGSGTLNVIHAGTHIIQFVQSIFLVSYSNGHNHDWLHSPWMSGLWGLVGLSTLLIGIKDYNHHKKCKRIVTY